MSEPEEKDPKLWRHATVIAIISLALGSAAIIRESARISHYTFIIPLGALYAAFVVFSEKIPLPAKLLIAAANIAGAGLMAYAAISY